MASDCAVRVAVVAELCFYRESLVELLARDDRIAVDWAASHWREAIAAGREPPDVLVFDLQAPGAEDAVRRLADAFPSTGIVALGLSDSGDEVPEWAERGIAGYVTRKGSLNELREMIVAVSRGELPCPPRVSATLLRHVAALASERRRPQPEATLTSREREVAALIDEGLSNKQIASRLYIEVPTVKNHVHNILEKLAVSRRGEAAARLRSVGPGPTN